MKEIGELLREKREEIGITTEEVATDLKISPSQIENIEIGNREVFKDVFELKKIIREYSKYLNLDPEKIEDQFNEFLFEYTSKIPLEEIVKTSIEIQKEQDSKKVIRSPYTKFENKKFNFLPIIIAVVVILIAAGIAYLFLTRDEELTINNKSYGVNYESSK